MNIKYKIINNKNNNSIIMNIENINVAYHLLYLYDPSTHSVEEMEIPKFKGPFCMHCHSAEHLGIDCPERDAFDW